MRQIFGDVGWEKKLMVFFGVLVILTLLGPFGTYQDLGFWERFVFWSMIVGGVGFCMHITMTVCLQTPRLGKAGKVVRLLIGSALGAIPGAAIVVFVNTVFRPPTISAESVPIVWVQVGVIGFFIGIVEYIDWRAGAPSPTVEPVLRTKLHERFKSDRIEEIISMSMQDHYVEVTTSGGKELVLLRFADAIDEVEGVDGLRIHRSHWVANNQIADLKKQGHRRFVTLKDGRKLPVSEKHFQSVSEEMKRQGI